MKPIHNSLLRHLWGLAIAVLIASAASDLAAQELEVRQPPPGELAGSAGVELPIASSFEELEARQRAQQTAKPNRPVPKPQTARQEEKPTPGAAARPKTKPANDQSSAVRAAIKPPPLPLDKPAEPIEPASAAQVEDTPIELLPPASDAVGVVDSFSNAEPRELDDSARR